MHGQPYKMTQAAAATFIATSGRSFIRGQKIEYTDPSLGGAAGLVCTTGGTSGGTAVWVELGVIAAS